MRNATSAASANSVFTFRVTLKDAKGRTLSGSFAVSGADETSVANGGTLTLHGNGSFTIEGLPHGAQYELTETNLPDGWTMTGSVNTTGTISANETAEASFENTYSTGGSVQLTAKKHFIGGEIEPEQFAFTLLESEGTELSRVYAEKRDDDASWGTIEFPVIGYTQADDGATYEYVIRETVGEETDVIYDTTEHRVRVRVRDNGFGGLITEVEYLDEADAEDGVIFTNRQRVDMTISKTIGGTLGDLTKKFDFTVRYFTVDEDGAETPYTEAITAPEGCDWTAVADAPGVYAFKLGHEQSITVAGLPCGVSYEVVEARVGDYVTTVTVDGGEAVESDTAAGVIMKATTVAYRNTLDGTVDTGIADAAPMLYSAGAGVIALGAYLALKLRRKDD